MALSLQVVENKTGVFFLTVTQADGVTPQNLTGSTLYFHAALGAFVINKNSLGAGITITDAVNGLATLQIDPADTAGLNLQPAAVQSMPCELTLVNGVLRFELASGALSVAANVGTP